MAEAQPAGESLTYQSQDSRLAMTFQYPSGWSVQEEEGKLELYSQVRLMGPRNAEDTYSPFIAVRVSPALEAGGRHRDAAELAQYHAAHQPPGARVTRDATQTVVGASAHDVTMTYTIPPLHHRGLKALSIPVTTRTLFLQRGLYLYELIYSADAREYERHAPVFEHVLQTFRFLENS